MADLRPWLKLWKCAYGDAKLERLSMEDRGRWLWLFLHVGINGERGVLTLETGLRELRDVLQTGSREPPEEAVFKVLKRLPGVAVTRDDFPSRSVTVTFTKWPRYQEDSSADRTRAWRQRKRGSDGNSASPVTPLLRHAEPVGDGSRSRSRVDTPLPPVGTVVPSPHRPAQPPRYHEPEPDAHRAPLQAIRRVLERLPTDQPRCIVTGHPVGTDTRPVGQPCDCENCRLADQQDDVPF